VRSFPVSGRLAPLAERPYRLFFSAATISTLGDSVAGIALAFAVLDLTGTPKPLYLAIVFAGRQLANGALVLYGGVLSDRLPRNRILVGAAIGQGAAQAATAAVVLSGRSSTAQLTRS
jgi:MFS family permease